MKLKVRRGPETISTAVLRFPSGVIPSLDQTFVYHDSGGCRAIVCEDREHNAVHLSDTNDKGLCKYAVGVFNKSERSLELVPVMEDRVLKMLVRVEGLQYAASNRITEFEGDTEVEQKTLGKRAAILAFGGATSKKILRRQELSKPAETSPETGQAIGAVMQSVAEKAERDGLTKTKVVESTGLSRNLPPHHLDGTSLEEAFVFDELCPQDYRGMLDVGLFKAAALDKEAKMSLRRKGESVFVLDGLRRLELVDGEEVDDLAARMGFLSLLMRFRRMIFGIKKVKPETKDGFASQNGINPRMFSFLLETFFDERRVNGKVTYGISETKKKLLNCYVLIVALMVSDSELDSENLEVLRADLGIAMRSLVSCFKSIGASVIGKTASRTVRVKMLKNGKTLEDSLPKIRVV